MSTGMARDRRKEAAHASTVERNHMLVPKGVAHK
jgi:hypothetical protein